MRTGTTGALIAAPGQYEYDILYTLYISRVKFFANQDFKTFSRVVKFAIEEEYTSRIHASGSEVNIFACC